MISLSIKDTPQTRKLIVDLNSPKLKTRKAAESRLVKVVTPALIKTLRLAGEGELIKAAKTPINKYSLRLKVPKTFGFDSFNVAATAWRKHRADLIAKKVHVDEACHLLVGRRQMTEIRNMARTPAPYPPPGFGTLGIEIHEKDCENWFEVSDRLLT